MPKNRMFPEKSVVVLNTVLSAAALAHDGQLLGDGIPGHDFLRNSFSSEALSVDLIIFYGTSFDAKALLLCFPESI
jgi:hypothetical protein